MKIAAVIVTFNRKELLVGTIKSLKSQSRKLDNIYIIDNASTDGTYEYLVENNIIKKEEFDRNKIYKYKYDDITYLRMEENGGGAGGFHEGIKIAHQEKHDWIWIMDDDVTPDVEAMYNYEKIILHSEEEIGALMGLRYYEDIPFSFESTKHDFKNYKNLKFKGGYLSKEELNTDELIRIYDMPFEGPIINSKIIDKIGYPNKDFFIIGDDTDYSIKINKHAHIYLAPTVRIDRMINPYVENVFGWKEFYTMRNIIYLNSIYCKNNKVKYLRTFNIYAINILSAVKKVIFNRDKKQINKIFKVTEAYISGMKGNLGKKYLPGDF